VQAGPTIDPAPSYIHPVAACPACGRELPGELPFCPFCGAPPTAAPPAPAREERNVVSVLFCDLVGFTAASEAVDTPRTCERGFGRITLARDLFASMGYKPALAETQKLLAVTVAKTA
jgi:hypothetical protein